MSISWITKSGSLGTIPESQFYLQALEAVDSDELEIFYSFISGKLPEGMYITRTGELRGTPTLLSNIDQTLIFSFTVRATNENGSVADRSFSLSVSNATGPRIVANNELIGAWFDGNFLDYQFTAVNDNPVATASWSIVAGSLPPGVTLSTTGRLSGFVDIIASTNNQSGYEVGGVDQLIYDALPVSTDRFYNFTLQATDGEKFSTTNVRLLIVSKGNFTADNAITLINNTFISIDADNKYRPIILNTPESLPILISGSTFAYKFIAYDPEDENVSWEINELAFSGLDELDRPLTQSNNGFGSVITVGDSYLNTDGTVGPLNLVQSATTNRLVIYKNQVLLTPFVDYSTSGATITFTSPVLVTDVIEIAFIETTTGYDSLLFDQGASGLPAGLSINPTTGWIFGVLPNQIPDLVTYSFRITAFRTLFPTFRSDAVSFDLTVKRTLNEEIVWVTNATLPSIDNGAVSEIAVEAYNTLGKELEYSIVYQNYRRIPQGLKFLPTGRFTGRTTFRYFSLDGAQATLNVISTDGLTIGMQVQGPGVVSGCRVTAIIDNNTVEVRPAIYVEQGTLLTFTSQSITKIISTTSNSISTAIDGGATTFDTLCRFTVKASAVDGSISSEKTFTIRINPYNLAPYENIYLRSLPSEEQRALYKSITENFSIFPQSLIYRPDDPNFGVSKSFKFLFLAGLTPATANAFIDAVQFNHFNKTINFGEIKTAIAKDPNGSIRYEVVYVDAVDTAAYNTTGPQISINPAITNGYLFDGEEFKTIYPNSFNNMQTRIQNNIGFTNRGALPTWMTSVQENGLVLGLTRAVVLAYVKPGASKLIAYRLQKSLANNTANFSFIADRYQWDNSLSTYYNPLTASFEPSKETTFDKYSNESSDDYIDTVTVGSAVLSNTIRIPDNIVVAQGWVVLARDDTSTIPDDVVITNVQGNLITLSDTVTTQNNSAIRIIGETKVDYAVSVSFATINGKLLSELRNNLYIDGVVNFLQNETIIFRLQTFPGENFDGWYYPDGTVIPGYLDKISGVSTANRRGGSWKITWDNIPVQGFDSDDLGFDQASPNLNNSYYDQGDDSEVNLVFVNEVLFNQRVSVRSGKNFPNSILTYSTAGSELIPRYLTLNFTVRTGETTFDGGTCCVREKDVAAGRQGIRGGLGFFTNRDKYIKPESKDKYIKFPKNGVFV